MRRSRKNWSKYLELLFRDAALTMRRMPSNGCKPAQLRSGMPEVVRSRRDMDFAPDRTELGRVGATRAAITRLDFAHVLITGASLTTLQRNLIWDRADNKMWKQISHLRGTPIRTLQREYFKALAELCAYAIARHKKSLAHIRWRRSAAVVVDFRNAA